MNGQEPQVNKKLHVPGWIVLLIIIVLFGAMFYMQPSSQSDVVPGESIVVEEREDGRLVVSDLENGFEVVVPYGFQAAEFEGSITLTQEDEKNNDFFSGLRAQVNFTDVENVDDYFKSTVQQEDYDELEKNYEQIQVGDTVVELLTVDWSTSFWPSSGGLEQIYHFSKEDAFINLNFGSIDSKKVLEEREIAINMIRSILSE